MAPATRGLKAGRLSPSKILFQILQCVHHLTILREAEGKRSSKLFIGKINELDRWQKVACDSDNPKFAKDMHKLNLDYRECVIETNIEHYEYMLQFKRGSLSALHLTKTDMETNIQSAKSLAKRAFKRKYNENDAKKMIT